MERFYVVKDGKIWASTASRESAIDLIRAYQEDEKKYYLRAQFSIIKGTEEYISYE